MPFLPSLLLLALLATVPACTVTEPPKALYFDSPRQAVEVASELLKAHDWTTLARYYDLSGSGIPHADLESGAYFYTKERPDVAHPAGFWRYKHPFSPGFAYLEHEMTGADTARVTVQVTIDQGAGPPQIGRSSFEMRKSSEGWQFLPGAKKP